MSRLRSLLEGTHPAAFWRLLPEVPLAAWEPAIVEALAAEPQWAVMHSAGGWGALAEWLVGEAQFGPARYRLSLPKRAYYVLKPVLPRGLMFSVRRGYTRRQQASFPLAWPVEDRFITFLHSVLAAVRRSHPEAEPAPFWPADAEFAFVLTHDIELASGHDFVRTLADLDEQYGFRSCFNFVPERYAVDHGLLAELRERGHEVGVHGLKHDGKLFSSRREFERRAQRINSYLREWGSVGFRCPLAHRNPEWLQALEIEYDSSFFDSDPYEPMPGGTMLPWPFLIGRFVELPYTLPQDHTLLITLGERTPRLWLEKLEAIRTWGAMALLNTHPDYLRDPRRLSVYEDFLRTVRERAGYWNGVPRDVARWWRARLGGAPGSNDAVPAQGGHGAEA